MVRVILFFIPFLLTLFNFYMSIGKCDVPAYLTHVTEIAHFKASTTH